MATRAADWRSWPLRALTAVVVIVVGAVTLVVVSPSGVGRLMLWLGLVDQAPAQAFRDRPGMSESGEGHDWQPGEDLLRLRPLYAADQELASRTPITFTFLYDLPPAGNAARCGYGFAVLIEGLERVILYDAGLQPEVLAGNARALGKSLEAVEVLVISHGSEDHWEGVHAFADVRRRPIGYFPRGLNRTRGIERYVSEMRPVESAARLMRGVYTTGPAPGHPELALILATPQGPVHLLSCGHVGRVPFLDHALRLTGRPIYLDIGGFCPLWGAGYEDQIEAWIRVRERDPRYIAFCHCAPDALRQLAAAEWPGRDVYFGGGTVITVPAGPPQPPIVKP